MDGFRFWAGNSAILGWSTGWENLPCSDGFKELYLFSIKKRRLRGWLLDLRVLLADHESDFSHWIVLYLFLSRFHSYIDLFLREDTSRFSIFQVAFRWKLVPYWKHVTFEISHIFEWDYGYCHQKCHAQRVLGWEWPWNISEHFWYLHSSSHNHAQIPYQVDTTVGLWTNHASISNLLLTLYSQLSGSSLV